MVKKIIALTLVLCFCFIAFSIPASAEEASVFEQIKREIIIGWCRCPNLTASAPYQSWNREYIASYYCNVEYIFADPIQYFLECPDLMHGIRNIFEEIGLVPAEEFAQKFWDVYSRRFEKDYSIDDLDEMPLVTIIKECNIQREQFEQLLEKFHCSDYFLLDLDLIYSFDNERINEYYRYVPFDLWEENGERRWRYVAYSFPFEYLNLGYSMSNAARITCWESFYYLFDSNGHYIGNDDQMPLYMFLLATHSSKNYLLTWYRYNFSYYDNNLGEYVSDDTFRINNAGTEFAELPNLDVLFTHDYELISDYYSAKHRAIYNNNEKDTAICSAVINYLANKADENIEKTEIDENGVLKIYYKDRPDMPGSVNPADFYITQERDDAVRLKYNIFGNITDNSTEIYEKSCPIDLVLENGQWKVVENAFPQTGESTSVVFFTLLAFASLSSIGLIVSKRRIGNK